MAERSASVPYVPYPTESVSGAAGGPMSVRSTPNDFGAQVSEAQIKVGQEGFELAQKQQGIINDSLMTKADADFATKVGRIKGDYQSLTGMAAYNAFPQYQKDIQGAFEESRSNLPAGAQHGFDMLAARSMANHMADGSSYAASQLKEDRRDQYSNLASVAAAGLLDHDVASSPERSKEHLDTIKYAAEAQIDDNHPGLKTDPETGTVSFDESTPEGRQGKADLQRRTDTLLSQGYVNRYDTLAKQDVFGAYDAYQRDRADIPKSAQVALDASFAPKIQAAHTQIATGNTLNHAANEHWDMLTNPDRQQSEKISNAIFSQESGNKFSNQVSSSGAIGGAQIMPATFSQYAKQGESIDNPEDNKAVGKRIVDDYTKRYNGDASRVAVAYFSGPGNVAPAGSATPWIKDTTDSDGKSVSSYVSDVSNRVGQPTNKTYATNENGAPLSQADYYRTHSNEVLAKGDAYAEQQMPGDLALKRAVRQTLSNEMNRTISNEHQQQLLDNRNVMKAINGDLTQGKPPETEEELRAIPGVGPLLDKVATQDPKFLESIPTLIAKVARRNDVTNSANGYDTITRVLQPSDDEHPNHIKGQDQLDHLLGRSDGTGINMKDYNDAKPATDLDSTLKGTLLRHMQEISTANGNLDGKGQQRAVQWYNQAMAAVKKNEALGDKKEEDIEKILPPTPPAMPSRMGQLSKLAEERAAMKQAPTFTSWDDPEFKKLAPGTKFMADGKLRTKK